MPIPYVRPTDETDMVTLIESFEVAIDLAEPLCSIKRGVALGDRVQALVVHRYYQMVDCPPLRVCPMYRAINHCSKAEK